MVNGTDGWISAGRSQIRVLSVRRWQVDSIPSQTKGSTTHQRQSSRPRLVELAARRDAQLDDSQKASRQSSIAVRFFAPRRGQTRGPPARGPEQQLSASPPGIGPFAVDWKTRGSGSGEGRIRSPGLPSSQAAHQPAARDRSLGRRSGG
ncbi:hypothetical protein CDD83_8891 [Cordyceps sp. RAO-2017]|nr:hypothetical protein CDD83_8891 [Cordyceps sp. RAO-2017]